MTTLLAATLFTFIAIGAAYIVAPKPDNYGLFRLAFAWAGVTVLTFWIPSNLFSLLAIGLFLGFVAPTDMARRAIFFVGIVAASPDSFSTQIPFPGLNYLISLNYTMVVSLAVALPAFLTALGERRRPEHLWAGRLLFGFVLLTSLMAFRELPLTSVIRFFVNQMILIYIPFLALSHAIKDDQHAEIFLKTLFFSIMVVAFVGLMSTLRNWNYYTLVADSISAKMFLDTRSGFLRVGATLGPTLLAFLCGVGVVLAHHFRGKGGVNPIIALGAVILLGFVAFVTGGRGGQLAGLVAIAGYFVFLTSAPLVRRLFVISMAVVGVVLFWKVATDPNFIGGERNNIVYRAELIRASIGQIAERPFFGSHRFLESPRFSHLVQGEGIIDVVNYFLEITLKFGLVGFAIWGGAYISGIRAAFSPSVRARFGKSLIDEDRRRLRAPVMMLCFLLGYLVMAFTISNVSKVGIYGYVLLAAAVAIAGLRASATNAEQCQAEKDPALSAPEDQPVGGENEDGPKAYGARFVRRI